MGSHPPNHEDPFHGDAAAAEAAPERKRQKRAELTQRTGEDLDETQPDWWKPQPHATLDPGEAQDRPAAPLTACLCCCLCHRLLREAITAPECGHSYCYDCIEAAVEIGGNHNVCPAPVNPGSGGSGDSSGRTSGICGAGGGGAGGGVCGAILGPSPFDHHRLVYDSLLDGLVRKVFPRPALDAALAARRSEREEATRRAREQLNG
ncbi:hypothetical protein Agub_g9744 [Astrephomene gubernaculifera]|uniref:RING-type domain-containing protein n=1 Tax=Astrephomene gubernaculifera TaxID=47775 RepID=A0AAD3DY61_9CHLO|nr:hypothetical protein Agub_g9744 [Astrephomene gubernaculifera]